MDGYLQPLPWAKIIVALQLMGCSRASKGHAHIISHQLNHITSPVLKPLLIP